MWVWSIELQKGYCNFLPFSNPFLPPLPCLSLLSLPFLSFSFLFFSFLCGDFWNFINRKLLNHILLRTVTIFLTYFGIFAESSLLKKTIPSPWGCHLHQRRWRLQIVPHALLSRRQKLNGLYRMTCQRSTISVSHFEIGAVLVGEAVKIKIAELIRTGDIRKVSMNSRWSHVKSPDAFQHQEPSCKFVHMNGCSKDENHPEMMNFPFKEYELYELWRMIQICYWESTCHVVSPNSGEHPLDELPQWERQNRPKTPPCSPKLIVPPAEIPSSLLAWRIWRINRWRGQCLHLGTEVCCSSFPFPVWGCNVSCVKLQGGT